MRREMEEGMKPSEFPGFDLHQDAYQNTIDLCRYIDLNSRLCQHICIYINLYTYICMYIYIIIYIYIYI
jgi:hypothetical protein